MKNCNKGELFVVSGPSGVGKGTILEKVLNNRENMVFSISATTRPPRPGEVDGRHYYFINKDTFEEMRQNEEFLESAHVHNNYYGTPEKAVEQQLNEGKDVILDIDVQGALQVMEKRPDATFVFIAPAGMDPDILKQRLEKRRTEDEKTMQSRIKTAIWEMSQAGKYRYVIYNDELEEAVKDLNAIVRARHLEQKPASK